MHTVEIFESPENTLTAYYIDDDLNVVYMDTCGDDADGLFEMVQDYIAVAVTGDDLSRWECLYSLEDIDIAYRYSLFHDTLIAKSHTEEFYGATDTTRGTLGAYPDETRGIAGAAFVSMLLDED